MHYDLTGLSERQFEHITQALAVGVITASTVAFGDGPDGGREAAFDGFTAYPDPKTGAIWAGHGVIQAKFKNRLTDPDRDASWLKRELTKEFGEWRRDSSKRGTKANPIPEYFIAATNLSLSAVPDSGGIDSVSALLTRECTALGILGWDIWDYNRLRIFLDNNQSVRTAYSGFITPGDVLAQIWSVLGTTIEGLDDALFRHGTRELRSQQWVRLSQAGSQTAERVSIANIGSELTIAPGRSRISDIEHPALQYLLDTGETIYRRSYRRRDLGRRLIIGGPGQGKSTIVQMLQQVYRANLLAERLRDNDSKIADLAEQLSSRIESIVGFSPRHRRWPLAIDLSLFGERVSGLESTSLLRYATEVINDRGDATVRPTSLLHWLEKWPSLIVLDGLDEVANPKIRSLVNDRIEEFLDALEVSDCDAYVVGTTRPQGYNNELSRLGFEPLALKDFTSSQAVAYADLLIAHRHEDDPDLAASVSSRVRAAAQEPVTSRLMRSPLQVTIISLLLERLAKAPDSRYKLFDEYYKTIYEREVAKPGPIALLLEQQRSHIDLLHERVAFTISLEDSLTTEPTLPESKLREMTTVRLVAEGYGSDDAAKFADQLLDAATKRLVLLAPVEQDHIGFDVRSLREYMTARAVTNIEDTELMVDTLRSVSTSAYWRNTWLLAAGRLFRSRERLRERIVGILREIDARDTLSALIKPGAKLAMELIDDDTAARQPLYQRLLAQHAAMCFEGGADRSKAGQAESILDLMDTDREIREVVFDRIDRILGSSGHEFLTAILALSEWSSNPTPVGAGARQRLARALKALDKEKEQALIILAKDYPSKDLRRLENRETPRLEDNVFELLQDAVGVGLDSSEARLPTVQAAHSVARAWLENGGDIIDGLPEEVVAEWCQTLEDLDGPDIRRILLEVLRAAYKLPLPYYEVVGDVIEMVESHLVWRPPIVPSYAIQEVLGSTYGGSWS